MLFRSQVYTDARGSIGGVTYTRNRAGLIARGRVKPIDPQSADQIASRSRFADLASDFKGLTDQERAAWDNYALLHPYFNKLGEPVRLTANAMYLAYNAPRAVVGLGSLANAAVASGPSSLDDHIGSYAVTEVPAGGTITVEWTTGPTWAGLATGRLAIFASKPQSADRATPVGGYRFVKVVNGSTSSAPVTSGAIVVADDLKPEEGRRTFVRLFAIQDNNTTNLYTASQELIISKVGEAP
jgi:hypothetical protein